MQIQDIINQLNDVPATFQRPGTGFQQLMLGEVIQLFRYCNAVDGMSAQTSLSTAEGPWLDVWGGLFNIPRNANETDDAYYHRISFTLTSGRCTPVAIVLWIINTLGLQVTISENFMQCRWTLTFSTPLTSAQYTALAQNLGYVRPAGVPFLPFNAGAGGLYLGTVNFSNEPRMTGAYFDNPTIGFIPVIAPNTDNATPLLPTTFLTDTTINPSLAQ